jgi:hypothetical protein
MFTRSSGKPRMEWYPKLASTAYKAGELLYFNASGAVISADSTSGVHVGVCQSTVTSADADYALTTPIQVDVAGEDDIFEATVTGTLTTAMVGSYYDLSTSLVVNVAAQSKGVVLCVGFISTTKGLFKITAKASDHYVATT